MCQNLRKVRSILLRSALFWKIHGLHRLASCPIWGGGRIEPHQPAGSLLSPRNTNVCGQSRSSLKFLQATQLCRNRAVRPRRICGLCDATPARPTAHLERERRKARSRRMLVVTTPSACECHAQRSIAAADQTCLGRSRGRRSCLAGSDKARLGLNQLCRSPTAMETHG
jgi:hypothetical protein